MQIVAPKQKLHRDPRRDRTATYRRRGESLDALLLRFNQVVFNAGVMREMRARAFMGARVLMAKEKKRREAMKR